MPIFTVTLVKVHYDVVLLVYFIIQLYFVSDNQLSSLSH